MTDTLMERAHTLGLHGLLAHWGEVAERDWIAGLTAGEEEERRARSLTRRLADARLGQFKPLADFDWDWPRRCDRMAVEDLMGLDFLKEAANLVLVGPNGVGKSTIAANIAHRAVLEGHTVRFATAASLLGELAALDSDTLLQRRLRFYARQHLLVIDEVGYLSYSNRHADLLFNIVSSRSQQNSTIITTNRPFAEWGEAFPNAACRGTPEAAQRRTPPPTRREGRAQRRKGRRRPRNAAGVAMHRSRPWARRVRAEILRGYPLETVAQALG